jgi:putative transposase
MHPGRPKRLPSFSYRGPWRYSLTFCAAHQHRAFVSADVVGLLVEQIVRTCKEQHFEVLAYCFMPDHVHLLLEGLADHADLRACGRLVRQRMALAYTHRVGRRLWQPGYWERVLREGDATEQCARYIYDNPVRRGLVRAAGEYPYSGGTWFERILAG